MKLKFEPFEGWTAIAADGLCDFTLPMAVLGGAGISGLSSLIGSFMQSNAANNSIQAQEAMFQEGANLQQSEYQQGLTQLLNMYGMGVNAQGQYVQQGVSALTPFANAGAAVAPTLTSLITPGANMTSTLEQIPGFQFAQQYGQKAITNQATTRGLSGNALTAGADYATGSATQSYGGIVQALQNLLGTGAQAGGQIGSLLGSAGNTALLGATNVGTSALSNATTAGNAILGAANTLGANIGTTTQAQGNALASGVLGAGNAAAGATSSLGNLALLNALSGGKLGGGSLGLFGSAAPPPAQ